MLHYASLLLYGLPTLFILSKFVGYLTWYITTFNAAHRFAATSTVPSVTVSIIQRKSQFELRLQFGIWPYGEYTD